MDGIGFQVSLVALLVLLNAAFSGSEFALVSLREGQLARLARRSATGRVLAGLARDPNRFLSTIQLGVTLTGFLASATAAVAIAEPLVGRLPGLGAAARPVAVVTVTLVLTFVTLVVGELVPKRLALQRAEPWALLAARPLDVLSRVAAPLIWLLSRATDLVVGLLGGEPHRRRDEVTPAEIRDLIDMHRGYTDAQRTVISGALEVAERTLREVVVPRSRVLALPEDTEVGDALATLAARGHSRAPVYRDGLDDADRVISVLALVGRRGRVADHARPATALPESLDAVAALRELQRRRQQLALVVSEYGGVEGIVTVEDLLEELVGEIYDEHDRDVRTVVHQPGGAVVVPGDFPVHDLDDLDVEVDPAGLATEEAATVAGLVMQRLGRLPAVGDVVDLGEHTLEVLEVRGRTAGRVRIRRRHPTEGHDLG